MLFFTSQKTISAIKRQVYTANKSTYTSTGATATGYLRPLNEEQSSANGVQYGLGFSLILETDVDILQGDRLTIDSVDYTVRGVVNHDRGGIVAYKRAILLKPEA